jgi:uncharacterized protein (DUF2062 family)
MPRRLIKRFTARFQPAVDRLVGQPWVRRYVPALADPDLWHLNRHSTACAVAIGLACGLVPGPLQALSALALCLLIRANFPLAFITTFYTNPLTIVPIYVVAYEFGLLFMPGARHPGALKPPQFAWTAESFHEFVAWMSGLGRPLALGLVLLAATLAALGYVAVRVAWRWHTVRAWRRRARQRALPA